MENIALRLHNITEQFTKIVLQLDISLLSLPPRNGGWNIIQITEHIISVNTSYFPIFSDVRKGLYRLGWWQRIPFISRTFGNLLIQSVHPRNRRKSSTFPMWQPSRNQSFASTDDFVQHFIEHQKVVEQEIVSTIPFISKHTIIASPANPIITYPFYSAIEILLLHEERHILQIQDTLSNI